MFNWKKLFRKRVEPKEIPVLDDIVEDEIKDNNNQTENIEDYPHLFSEDTETASEDDEFIINLNDGKDVEQDIDDENNVVILSSVIGENITDVNIDEIDNIENNDDRPDSLTEEAIEESRFEIGDGDENQTVDTINEVSEVAEETEEDLNDLAETDTSNNDDETTLEDSEENHFDPSDPEQLEVVVNRVVEQIKPEIDQQLHDFVQKALTDKKPEEFLQLFNLDTGSSTDKKEENGE